jgi:uncharacterized protein YprB with RNaseH-like and TPR domain
MTERADLKSSLEAYLDIETTGLSAFSGAITVVGVYLCNEKGTRFVQLVGREITRYNLLEVLEGVDVIYTYNGSRFDLPFINVQLGVNLEELFNHRDLMYDCWRYNLRGGFKAVERQLGISRELVGVDGRMAVRLWWRYVDSFDLEALDTLLSYNREDVVNLKALKEMLL